MDQAFIQGARNAIRVCMNVAPADRVFIIADLETLSIAQAIETEARAVGAETLIVPLEEFGRRPLLQFPDGLDQRATAFSPTVTFYTAVAKEGEQALRNGLIGLILMKLGARHAHMPGITAQIMREGLRADYHQVNELTMRVYELLCQAKTIHVTSADGTDFAAHFTENTRWLPQGGLYHQQREAGNLPEGEVWACPTAIEGRFAARVLGAHFSAKYGVLSHPLILEISNSRVVNITGEPADLIADLNAYLDTDENSRRIGEFAIGTNIGLQALCGNMLQDEKIPGVHIAPGDPLGHLTGENWSSKTHVDIVNPGCTVEMDGKLLMKDGIFADGMIFIR